MARNFLHAALWLALAITTSNGKVSLLFSENSPGTYFKTTEQSHGHLTKDDLTATAAALLNVGALSHVDADTASKVAGIVKASPFEKPGAIAAFILGSIHEGAAESVPGKAQAHEASQKEVVLQTLTTLSQSHSIEHTSLDLSSISDCGDICLETSLQEAIQSLGLDANYTQGPASMRGILAARMEGSRATFDLQSVSDRLFAIELASTWRAVTDAAAEKLRRANQEPEGHRKPQLIERVLISVQAIREAYGEDSQQYRVACCLIRHLIADSIERLNKAYNNRLATIVATFDKSEFSGGSAGLVELLGWSARSQRPTRSLLATTQASSSESYIQGFIAWIAMWGTFFLLLFFAFSGCHCLKSMKFKQDSLLYGKNKTD